MIRIENCLNNTFDKKKMTVILLFSVLIPGLLLGQLIQKTTEVVQSHVTTNQRIKNTCRFKNITNNTQVYQI